MFAPLDSSGTPGTDCITMAALILVRQRSLDSMVDQTIEMKNTAVVQHVWRIESPNSYRSLTMTIVAFVSCGNAPVSSLFVPINCYES